MNHKIRNKFPLALLFVAFSFAACSDNTSEPALEADFEVTIENTGTPYSLIKSGAFSVPAGASEPAPLFPGEAYEFEFTAPVGSRLTLATMFVQSNDWFYAPGEEGVALYDENGDKITGDITASFQLYDSGTEADEEPGTGANQAPRQSGADSGPADPDNTVRLVDTANLPSVSEVINVTLTSTSTYGFRVRIENVSTSSTLNTSEGSVAVPLSPGVFAVHGAGVSGVLFETGQPDKGNGLEAIAEDGSPAELLPDLTEDTGATAVLSPGAFAVYTGNNPLFTPGEMFPMNGIEGIAEDGTPMEMAAYLAGLERVSESGAFAQPVGASENGPLFPGGSYTFTFTAQEGEVLNLATMYVQSNDLFYSSGPEGIALFENGTPVTGDITASLLLWDAGTEENEEPGIGSYQAPRQSGPDMGPSDMNENVRLVDDSYTYPPNGEVLRVTLRIVQ